jgi:hypothetical protein
MEIHGVFSISAVVIVVGLILILYGKQIKCILERLRNVQWKDLHMDMEVKQDDANIDLTYQKNLISKDPPDDENKIQPAIAAGIKKEMRDKDIVEPQKAVDHLVDRCAMLAMLFSYLSLYSTLYGSQITILWHLKNNKSATLTDLKTFYDDAVRRFQEFYKNKAFGDYINFLTNSHLIIQRKNRYELTGLGKGFLSYLDGTKLPPRLF